MTVIQKLPNIVYPLSHVNKTNEIIDALNDGLNSSYSEENPILEASEGICTWTVTHNLGSEDVLCTLYEGDDEVLAKVEIVSENVVNIMINSATTIAAETYSVIVLAKGGAGSAGGTIEVDSSLSPTSTNPVQNRVIYNLLGEIDTALSKFNTGV